MMWDTAIPTAKKIGTNCPDIFRNNRRQTLVFLLISAVVLMATVPSIESPHLHGWILRENQLYVDWMEQPAPKEILELFHVRPNQTTVVHSTTEGLMLQS